MIPEISLVQNFGNAYDSFSDKLPHALQIALIQQGFSNNEATAAMEAFKKCLEKDKVEVLISIANTRKEP